MSVAFGLVFVGFLLAIAGLKDVSVFEALRGNFDQPKQPIAGVGAA